MARFNKIDEQANRNARQILRNPSSSEEDKAAARRTIKRLKVERSRRIETRKIAGDAPQREQFETEAAYKIAREDFWRQLDRAAIERENFQILNDPNSSVLVRTRAYIRLGLQPPETLRTDDTVAKPPKETERKITIHRLSDDEFAQERLREQKFLDELAQMHAAEKEMDKSYE